jgi:hypothetical protein
MRVKVNPVSKVQAKGMDQQLPQAQSAASRGLAAMFGLNIRAAFLAIFVDMMVFGVDTFSAETLIPLGIAIAGVLGFIVYKIQRKMAGDDHDTALIKAFSIGLLTAIPIPLTPLVAIPGGLLGIVNSMRRR